MKIIRIILKIVRGSCAEEEKSIEVLVPVMSDLVKINNEAMVTLGILVAMLTEAFGDHSRYESYQSAFLTIKIACDSRVCTLYDKECFIPCTGREHLLWLNKIREEVKGSLRRFLINVALKPSERSQL